MDICVYHNPCSDGLLSAWCVNNVYPAIKYIKYKFQKFYDIEIFRDASIVFADCCPPLGQFENILAVANKILVIDHHKTTIEVKTKYEDHEKVEFVFDMNKSGCMLSWEYFNKDSNIDIPWFISYAQDRDLWQFKLPNSKIINTGMYNSGYFNNFENITKVHNGELTLDEVVKIGTIIEKYTDNEQQYMCNSAIEANFEGHRVWLVTGNELYRSDIGNMLLDKQFKDGNKPAFTVFWRYNLPTNEFYLSLRGSDDRPDLTVICAKYGGGGHRNAAGCSVKNLFELITLN